MYEEYSTPKKRRLSNDSDDSLPTVVKTPGGINDAAGQSGLLRRYDEADRNRYMNQKFSKQFFKGTLITKNGVIAYSPMLVQKGQEPLFILVPATQAEIEEWKRDTSNRPILFNKDGEPVFKKNLFADDVGLVTKQLSNNSIATTTSTNTTTDEEAGSGNEAYGGKRRRSRISKKTLRKKQRPRKTTLRQRRG